MASLMDLLTMGGGGQVRAVGQGGSRNPWARQGPGQGSYHFGDTAPADMDMKWLGDNIGKMGALAMMGGGQGYSLAHSLATQAGTRTGARMPAYQPPPPRQQMFTGGWDGMRRNIGMPYGGGLGGAAGQMMGGGMGQPQRSPSPFGGYGASLAALLGGGYGNGGF